MPKTADMNAQQLTTYIERLRDQRYEAENLDQRNELGGMIAEAKMRLMELRREEARPVKGILIRPQGQVEQIEVPAYGLRTGIMQRIGATLLDDVQLMGVVMYHDGLMNDRGLWPNTEAQQFLEASQELDTNAAMNLFMCGEVVIMAAPDSDGKVADLELFWDERGDWGFEQSM